MILILDRDAALHETLAAAAPALEPELRACHQTARAAAEIAAGRVRVLVAGPSMLTAAGIRFLQQAHAERPDVVTLLVAGRSAGEIPARDLIRTGASDLVRFPAAPRTLRAALERAVDMAGAMAGARTRGTGAAYTITSPTGGCGKTFFATNLAYELATRTGKRVALIDLDLQFGEAITALRLRPQYTIHDLLEAAVRAGAGEEPGPDALKAQLREYMVRHPSGMEVLAAPRDPSEADTITSPEITEVLQVAKELYHYVIVDTPAALTEPVLAAFDLSERLVVMATLDVPSVRNLGVFLQTLGRLHIPAEGVSLVLNKAERDVGLTPAEVQRLFPQGFQGILPYSKEVSRSLNAGRPVVQTAPSCDVSQALAETIHRVLPGEDAFEAPSPVAAPQPRAGWLSRLRRRPAPAQG